MIFIYYLLSMEKMLISGEWISDIYLLLFIMIFIIDEKNAN